jgi:hypothetical protein
MSEKIELKWYEKRRGIKLADKIRQEKKKKERAEKKSAEKKHAESLQNRDETQKNPREKNEIRTQQNFRGKTLSRLLDEEKIPDDAKKILEKFDLIVDSTHPLNSRQKMLLPKQINAMSHFLTDERGERRMGYMNDTVLLSAYVRYFSWWNLVRLVRLFANLSAEFFNLGENPVCVDLGSGPMTVPVAIFLARPELRKKSVVFYCLDLSQKSLSFGENIFLSVAAELKCAPWKIVRIKGEIGSEIKAKADLVICANVFNELHDDEKATPEFLAKKYTNFVANYASKEKSKCILVEPGDPRSARLVSLMRDCFIRRNFVPVAPCPHREKCPMDGKRGGKWCNFAFSTESAPQNLKKISAQAELPKERAVLSFVAVEKNIESAENDDLLLRIASDRILLPRKKSGYYACSRIGLVLAVTDAEFSYGDLVQAKKSDRPLQTDEKSGAKIIKI